MVVAFLACERSEEVPGVLIRRMFLKRHSTFLGFEAFLRTITFGHFGLEIASPFSGLKLLYVYIQNVMKMYYFTLFNIIFFLLSSYILV